MKRDDAIKLLVEHRQEFTRFGVKSLALFGSAVWMGGRGRMGVSLGTMDKRDKDDRTG